MRQEKAGSTPETGFIIQAYGISVRFECASPGPLEELKEDFAHFTTPGCRECDVMISAHLEPPDLASLKGARRLLKTSKWTAFTTSSGARAVYYPEGLICEYDYERETGRISSVDPALLREISYLLIISRLGEKLDLKGLHRVHAMAAEFNGAGFIAAAPTGGGKTTLLLQLARDPAFTPLANDTPLVDSAGNLYPFPLRVGIAGTSPFIALFPACALRPFERRHYPKKYLLAPSRLSGNTPAKTRCRNLFLLKRGAGEPLIKKIGIPRAAFEMVKSLVLGAGVPQIAEYFLRPELSDLPAKARIILGRSAAALALLRTCGAFCFYLSNEPEHNARALKLFLSRKHTGSDAPSRL
jgi:hypothetical protein